MKREYRQSSFWCRSLRPAPFVYQGICELFEMYLVHVFAAFSDDSLADMLESEGAEVSMTSQACFVGGTKVDLQRCTLFEPDAMSFVGHLHGADPYL